MNDKMKKLFHKHKTLSLFSGCGGLDLGFAQAGSNSLDLETAHNGKRKTRGTLFEILWSNDIYKPSCNTYSENFDAEIYTDPDNEFEEKHRIFCGDVARILFEKAVNKEKIDVILGGFPCQDFSVIRSADKRQGVQVKRGRLYCHFVRALATLQPKMFVAENVKGLVTANNGTAYEWIKKDFENLNLRWNEIESEYANQTFSELEAKRKQLHGYELLFSEAVSFKNYGIPQARERLIIVGLRKDLASAYLSNQITGLVERLRGYNSTFEKYPLTTIETFEGKVLSYLQNKYYKIMSGFRENIEEVNTDRKNEYVNRILPKLHLKIWEDYFELNKNGNGRPKKTLLSEDLKNEIIESHCEVLKELGYFGQSVEEIDPKVDENNKILKEAKTVEERMNYIPPGENHEFVRNTKYHVTGLMSNIYRRINPLKPAYTVIARGGGGTWGYHYSKNRQRMTNRERARLQTFPDSFIFEGKPGEIRRQIGEAVPPLAGKIIAEGIAQILDKLEKDNIL